MQVFALVSFVQFVKVMVGARRREQGKSSLVSGVLNGLYRQVVEALLS